MKPAVTRKATRAVPESSPNNKMTSFVAPRLKLVTNTTVQGAQPVAGLQPARLPYLLTVTEVAEFLRTTRKAVYAMAERGTLSAVRVGRRLLFKRDAVALLLSEGSTPSAHGEQR